MGRIKRFFIENKLVTLLFILSTTFFILQHYFMLTWDFAIYIMNAKYWFYGGNYFEVYRAPLTSLILAPFLIFGKVSEYIFVIVVSGLFLYSTKKLSDALYKKYFKEFKINKQTTLFLFYFFNLNFFTLIYGLTMGSEILALSFFQLFLSYFILNKKSGHWLALAFLTRYNFYIFTPLLLFNKDIKKILKNIGLFLLVSLSWFIYSKIMWGNFFASFADALHLNVLNRLNNFQQLNPLHLLRVTNWFLPFLILGIIIIIARIIIKKERKISSYKYEILFLAITLIFLYEIYTIPLKLTRYLFNLVLPITFFSTIGAIFIIKKLNKEKFIKIFKIILIIGILVSMVIISKDQFKIDERDTIYPEAAQDIQELNISKCQIRSNRFAQANYYSGNIIPFPYTTQKNPEKEEVFLIFNNYSIPNRFKYIKDENNYLKIIEKEDYTILINQEASIENCKETFKNSKPLISNPCNVLSQKSNIKPIKNLILNTCRIINWK